MREIKFRAWDYEDKKIWKVVGINDSIWGDCEEAHIRICDFDKSPGDKETNVRLSVNFDLMQYTGLNDYNGLEIYEGDILTDGGEEGPLYIEYSKKHAAFVFVDKFDLLGTTLYTASEISYGGFEVIGNIYENPELIKWVNA